MKPLGGAPSEAAAAVAVLWPNRKVLVGAGAGVVELAAAPNRLGAGGVEEAGVLEDAAATKPKAGFATGASVLFLPNVNVGLGTSASVFSVVLPKAKAAFGSTTASGLLKEKPAEGAVVAGRFPVSFPAPKRKPDVTEVEEEVVLEAAEAGSFLSTGCPKENTGATTGVGSVLSGSPNLAEDSSEGVDVAGSAAGIFPKAEIEEMVGVAEASESLKFKLAAGFSSVFVRPKENVVVAA